ncbi:uncharacterized protein LOC134856111 [Symsagittifera roscoffensis]|uniref:uncharacterized protein LOC134856111 n=1 Tax=Symsagittifera roscoffensis TaxID=84072 RepID=UPI00307C425E
MTSESSVSKINLDNNDFHNCRLWRKLRYESSDQLFSLSPSFTEDDKIDNLAIIPKQFRDIKITYENLSGQQSSLIRTNSFRPGSNSSTNGLKDKSSDVVRGKLHGVANGVIGRSKEAKLRAAEENKEGEGQWENSWAGLMRYKQQKCLFMYPKSVERELLLIHEVYRKLLMQKLQVTMSEMDELRRPTRVHSGESSAYPSDMGLVRSIRLQQRVPRPGNNELNHDQIRFARVEDRRGRPSSASIPGKRSGLFRDGKKSTSSIDALNIDVHQKQTQCNEICLLLRKSEIEQTDLEKATQRSNTTSLYKSFAQNREKLAPYKVSLKDGVRKTQNAHKRQANNSAIKHQINSNLGSLSMKQKFDDEKFKENNAFTSKTAKTKLVQRYTHSNMPAGVANSNLGLIKTAEMTDFRDFRQFVTMTYNNNCE